ncbi:MAG: acyl-CoA thioesterase [Firmicutes bacterium]|nr:acyl-CoA thioesterase [Bacillota bacterium]
MQAHNISRLIKSEDLNHHGTLFAGRMAEWFIEGGFITAASILGKPDSLVCKKLHGLTFNEPINKGEIINIETKLVLTGTTSLKVYVKVTKANDTKCVVDGFITFVCVDEDGNKRPHNLSQPEAITDEEKSLISRAKNER